MYMKPRHNVRKTDSTDGRTSTEPLLLRTLTAMDANINYNTHSVDEITNLRESR